MRVLVRLTGPVAVIAAALAGWELLARSGAIGPAEQTTLGPLAHALGQLPQTAEFWAALGDTLASWSLGLLLATAIGVPLGMLIGASRSAVAGSRLVVDFLRTIPPVALVPLAVLVYGPTMEMKLVLIVYGAAWPLLVQALYAVREVDPLARDMARSYRVPRRLVVSCLVLPSAAPFVVVGLRIAAVIALLLSVSAEYVADAPGLGRELAAAQVGGVVTKAYAYAVMTGLLGVVINAVMLRAQRRIVFWLPAERAGGLA